MSTLSFEELLAGARELPPDVRLRLIEAICDDLPPESWPAPDSEVLAEVQRPSVAYAEGRMTAAPWAEVQNRVRRHVGLDR